MISNASTVNDALTLDTFPFRGMAPLLLGQQDIEQIERDDLLLNLLHRRQIARSRAGLPED